MRKLFVAFVLVLGAMALNATPAFAQASSNPCPMGDVKLNTGTNNVEEGTLPAGVTVVITDETVTVTLPAGMTASGCIKGGTDPQQTFSAGPGTTTVTYSGEAGISHVVLNFDTSGTTSTTTGGGDTTSTATTGGGDTSTATTGGGDTTSTSTATTGGGDTTSTSTGGGGAGGGGGGGAGGGGGGGSGELPFTGLPILVPLLLGGALLGSGIVLLRRGRQED